LTLETSAIVRTLIGKFIAKLQNISITSSFGFSDLLGWPWQSLMQMTPKMP
jgi:hypothetical protein